MSRRQGKLFDIPEHINNNSALDEYNAKKAKEEAKKKRDEGFAKAKEKEEEVAKLLNAKGCKVSVVYKRLAYDIQGRDINDKAIIVEVKARSSWFDNTLWIECSKIVSLRKWINKFKVMDKNDPVDAYLVISVRDEHYIYDINYIITCKKDIKVMNIETVSSTTNKIGKYVYIFDKSRGTKL